MNCHYCGAEVFGQEIFCRCCGTRQNPVPVQEFTAPVEPVVEPYAAPAPISAASPVAEELAEVVSVKEPPAWKSLEQAASPNVAPLFGLEEAPLSAAPRLRLPTKRSLCKMIFLGILTLGIYPIVIWSRLSGEVNLIASRYDGERSLSFFGMLMLAPLTLGILPLVWMHKLCRRIGTELERRNVEYAFGAKDFWLWSFLMSVLCSVCMGAWIGMYAIGSAHSIAWVLPVVSVLTIIGPFVFTHKLMTAMNKLNADYNVSG